MPGIIQFQHFPTNRNILMFDTDFEFPLEGRSITSFERPLRQEGSMWDSLQETEQTLVLKLLRISGVIQVNVYPYCVWVTRAPLFTWAQILTEVKDTFGTLYYDIEFVAVPAA